MRGRLGRRASAAPPAGAELAWKSMPWPAEMPVARGDFEAEVLRAYETGSAASALRARALKMAVAGPTKDKSEGRKLLNCQTCGYMFLLWETEKAWFVAKNLKPPSRCALCRARRTTA